MKKILISKCLLLSRPILILIVAVLFLSFSADGLFAQNTKIKKTNYKLAARFTQEKIDKMVFDTSVEPKWLEHSDRFWYSYETSEGKIFYIVDPLRKTKRPVFDNAKLAVMLTLITKDPYDAQHLPIDKIKFVKEDRAIQFEVQSSQEEEVKEKEKEEISEEKEKKPKKKIFTFEYELSTGKLTFLEDYKAPPKKPEWASLSPDEKTVVFAKNHNLFKMDADNYNRYLKDPKDPDIVEHQLTTDGEEHFSYAERRRDDISKDVKDKRVPASIEWSKDSKKFALIRSDSRKVNDLWIINSIAEPRPVLETYKYVMPGEPNTTQYELLIFDREKNNKIRVKADEWKDQSFIRSRRRSRDATQRRDLWLGESSDKLYFARISRDFRRVDICVASPETGDVHVLIEERLNTYIEIKPLGVVNDGKELIHWSERDGWAHFYLYDGEGKLKKQITSGPFHCDRIQGIDEKNRVLYFTANGREKDEDPYYLHLYRVNFDGTGLKLLNPGNFNHSVSLCDSSRFFVNNFSRVDTTPIAELRDNLGNKILDLETVDLSLLMNAGFKFPETFKVKADDGITDLYGVMYKPFDFDEKKQYPIIAYVYPGPQQEAVPKSFINSLTRAKNSAGLAQFGFIVVVVGQRGGHPQRSKWYHNYGYGNLRDYGLADKKAAIEQLADRHPFIDIDKVGIFGGSGGGFMSTAAMLVYPDFFKVAVSRSGNHDNNVYNRSWSEKHHGVREVVDEKGNITFEYSIDKNSEIAHNLKGHLLLVTGDMDNNVHPCNTLRVAEALIRANKRFDFFIFPGQRHSMGDMNPYFWWLRADYFCKHLIGDYQTSVDIIELNKDKELGGDKKN